MSNILDIKGSAEQKKKQRKEEKRLRDRQLSDIRKIIALPEGRRFYWRVLSEAGVFRSSFTGNSTTFFNEGRRSIGLAFFTELFEAKPEAFAQMQKENYSEAKSKKEDKDG